ASALNDIVPFIPHNPRKLKQFFRGLTRLNSVLKRHDESEIDWVLLLLLEAMRTISLHTAQKLIKSDSFRNELLMSQFGKEDKDRDDKWQAELRDILGKESLDKEKQTRYEHELKQIIPAIRDHLTLKSEANLLYWANLSEDPPIFTWKE